MTAEIDERVLKAIRARSRKSMTGLLPQDVLLEASTPTTL
jgi:hypothetical protein